MLTGEGPAVVAERQALALDWGISWPDWPDWPWTTKIRILFVIDGRINETSDPSQFGLGLVLETLRDISFAWWVRFIVTVRNRNDRFEFTQADFDIDAYDQIWFFGDWPGPVVNDIDIDDDLIRAAKYFPMEPDELEVIAAWMNNGGGVFAAGDHAMLGASMCHEIPRVRSMRRWTRANGVPSFGEPDRHETLTRTSAGGEMEWEADAIPQQIYPVMYGDWGKPFIFREWPHPLLCGKTGVIDRFPDHMHEGVVVDDDEVRLTDPLLPGSTEDEYPPYPIVVADGAIAGPPIGGGQPFELRPGPQVIAYGMTTHLEAPPKRFPLIGAYDGEPVHVGRVVVESTWHHWFSMNLVPLRDHAPVYYRGMQSYYRNMALWLASPAKRASMVFWATWGVLIGSQPGAFGTSLGVWGMGERVVDVLGRSAPQCIWSELVGSLMPPQVLTARSRRHMPWESVVRPPAAMVNEAILGGIATGMYDLARQHIIERAYGRVPRIAPEEIVAHGTEGIAIGMKELQGRLATAAESLGTLAKEPLDEHQADLAKRIQIGETVVDEPEIESER